MPIKDKEGHERQVLGVQARRAAEGRLRTEEAERLKRYIEEERLARGLSRNNTGESRAMILAKMERAQERLDKYRAKLEEIESN